MGDIRDYLVNLVLRCVLLGAAAVPYRLRVPAVGWFTARIVAPIAGYDRRIRANLALVLPALPEAEVVRLVRRVPDNAGRTLMEVYSGEGFLRRAAAAPVTGAGLAALDAARARGQGAILVSGHFGNYDVARGALVRQGFRIGALYKPWSNRFFDTHYRRIIGRISGPVFPRGRKGLGEMVRFLRAGGMVGMLVDQHQSHGAPLLYFGRAAYTALSAAELALKYDLLLVPVYGVRRADGLSFDLVVEPPVPKGTPEAMMQAVNDSLEAMVRAHLDQWFWIHRRWKPGRDEGAAAVAQPEARD
jgi:KDO2-lipid IV(A) lauroyltransferase